MDSLENARKDTLLDIFPREVRDMIYAYAVISDKSITIDRHNTALFPSILRTNRQVRYEATPLFLQHNTFHIYFSDPMQRGRLFRWLDMLGPRVRLLRRLTFRHWNESYNVELEILPRNAGLRVSAKSMPHETKLMEADTDDDFEEFSYLAGTIFVESLWNNIWLGLVEKLQEAASEVTIPVSGGLSAMQWDGLFDFIRARVIEYVEYYNVGSE